MAAMGGESPTGPDPALGGLDELIRQARDVARDPRQPEVTQVEARGYERGLRSAVYVLTGRQVAASTGEHRRIAR